jgi:hypothetical protein
VKIMGVKPLTKEMLAVASMDILSNPHTSAACGLRAREGVIQMEFSTVDVRSCSFAGLGRLETRKPIIQMRSIDERESGASAAARR